MTNLRASSDFWSRRRAAVAAEAEAEAALSRLPSTEAVVGDAGTVEPERSEADILAELGLRDPDEMKAGDDFSGFLNAAVPEQLRRRALRALWRSNPVLANLDGLVDHGEDFSDAATVVPGMQSTYQIGRGMIRHVRALAEAEIAEADGSGSDDIQDTPDELVFDATQEEQVVVADEDSDVVPESEPALSSRRHMRFSFSSVDGGEQS